MLRIAANPRLALLCALVVLLLLQVAVGGALGDAPVTPTDGDGTSISGP
jgi:hypothetical protein